MKTFRTTRRVISIIVLATVVLIVPAHAQSPRRVRGHVAIGMAGFSAAESVEAVAGTNTTRVFGAGATAIGLWRGVFVDVAFFWQGLDGERVFVDRGTVYRLGIPLTIHLRPLDVAAGWRFAGRRDRVGAYAGAGLSALSYEESSAFAEPGDDIKTRKAGAVVIGGADLYLGRRARVGADLRYRAVSGVLGGGGVSEAFGDDQLGGYSASLRISFGR